MLYVNISGMYGLGAYDEPEYRTLSDLLREMDRLGVQVSVTAQAEGRDLNTLFGNRKLMRDIAALPEAKDRILPCFAISPAMMFAQEEIDFLDSHLADGSVNFVSVYPAVSRHALFQIERVLAKIEKYRPVVLVNITELNAFDCTELDRLAERFPELHFVLCYVGWWHYGSAADLLWRRENIHLDISRLHFRDGITSTVRHFGNGRAVFGLGSAALEGAAMAALRYAKIDDAEKSAIAGETVLSLMPNKKRAEEIRRSAKSMQPKVKNSFWKPFIAGEGVKNTLVIDAHTHIGPMARGWFMPAAEIETHVAQMEEECKTFGISMMVSTPEPALFGHTVEGCEQVEQAVAGKESMFRGYLPFNPFYADDITDEFIDRKMRGPYYVGFKAIPEYWKVPIDSPLFDRIWRYAEVHRLPTLIHTWEGSAGTAARTEGVAAKHPDAFYIFGHSGGGTQGRDEAIAASVRCENIYLEFCGSFTARQRWEDTITKVDPKRVLFGTDTYPHDIAWELGRLLSCDIDDDTLRLILGENMKRLLEMRSF